jgi:hypothetical protein
MPTQNNTTLPQEGTPSYSTILAVLVLALLVTCLFPVSLTTTISVVRTKTMMAATVGTYPLLGPICKPS